MAHQVLRERLLSNNLLNRRRQNLRREKLGILLQRQLRELDQR